VVDGLLEGVEIGIVLSFLQELGRRREIDELTLGALERVELLLVLLIELVVLAEGGELCERAQTEKLEEGLRRAIDDGPAELLALAEEMVKDVHSLRIG
jgi:hypothetical protein